MIILQHGVSGFNFCYIHIFGWMAHSIGHVGRNIYETAIIPSNKVFDGTSVETTTHATSHSLDACMWAKIPRWLYTIWM